MLDDTTAILRLLVAFGLGFALGLERELRGQDAGLRTHILVCLGACLFTLVSIGVAAHLGPQAPGAVEVDISRIASQVVVGIGFLGGGSILHYGATVKGLTTAANLWLTASVGLAAGFGLSAVAAFTVALALFALSGLRVFERLILRLRHWGDISTEDNLASRARPTPEEKSPRERRDQP